MTLGSFLVLILIAAICGGIGQALIGYDLGGCLVSIFVGLIGAYVGVWVAHAAGLPALFEVNVGGQPFPVIWSIIGSAIFTAIIALIRRAISGNRYA